MRHKDLEIGEFAWIKHNSKEYVARLSSIQGYEHFMDIFYSRNMLSKENQMYVKQDKELVFSGDTVKLNIANIIKKCAVFNFGDSRMSQEALFEHCEKNNLFFYKCDLVQGVLVPCISSKLLSLKDRKSHLLSSGINTSLNSSVDLTNDFNIKVTRRVTRSLSLMLRQIETSSPEKQKTVHTLPQKSLKTETTAVVRRKSTRLKHDDFLKPLNQNVKNVPKRASVGSIECSNKKISRNSSLLKSNVSCNAKSTCTPRRSVTVLRKPTVKASIERVESKSNFLMQVSNSIESELPCREKHCEYIKNFIVKHLTQQTGACLYISGVPGTGKTATVTKVVNEIKGNIGNNTRFVYVNGMEITRPNQIYTKMVHQITGKVVAPFKALNTLIAELGIGQNTVSQSKKGYPRVFILVDELDMLVASNTSNGKNCPIYNIFDWPNQSKSVIVIVAIANAMDLPERLSAKVASRIGLNRLVFQSYDFSELYKIIQNKCKLKIKIIGNKNVEFIARKVDSLSGDVRRAVNSFLKICQQVEQENISDMEQIKKIIISTFTTPQSMSIMAASYYEKLLLQAFVSANKHSGLEECNVKQLYAKFKQQVAIEGHDSISMTEFVEMCLRLNNSRLILINANDSLFNCRIRLLVDAGEITNCTNVF